MYSNSSSFFSQRLFFVFSNQLHYIIKFIHFERFIAIKEINIPNAAAENVLTAHRTKIYFHVFYLRGFLLLGKALDHSFV